VHAGPFHDAFAQALTAGTGGIAGAHFDAPELGVVCGTVLQQIWVRAPPPMRVDAVLKSSYKLLGRQWVCVKLPSRLVKWPACRPQASAAKVLLRARRRSVVQISVLCCLK